MSGATDLTYDTDTNHSADIFVRDLVAGTTSLLTHSYVPGDTPLQSSGGPALSPDGTKLAFVSSARDIVRGDGNGNSDVFLLDLATGAVSILTWNAAGTNTANGTSLGPRFSPDGGRVLFQSRATNLVAGVTDDNGPHWDNFVHDLATGTTTVVSVNRHGTGTGSGPSSSGVFSPDGTKVAFASNAADLSPDDTNDAEDIYLRDLAAGTTTLVSVNAGGNDGGLQDSREPNFNADGTKVAFTSFARDLLPGDTNGTSDIYVRDLERGLTRLVSARPDGKAGESWAHFYSVSADSRKVLYMGRSRDLVPIDDNDWEDLYIATLHGVDLGVTLAERADPVVSGADLGYEVVVTNGGPDAGDAEVTVTLPAGVDFVAAGGDCTPPAATPQVVHCTVTGLGEGDEASLTIDVEVTAAAGSTLVASAEVTGEDFELDDRDSQAGTTTAVA